MTEQEQQKRQKVGELIAGLASDFKPEVDRIEASIVTTQNHYGDYGSLLSRLSGGNDIKAKLFVLTLLQAGANRDGVYAGYKLFVSGESL